LPIPENFDIDWVSEMTVQSIFAEWEWSFTGLPGSWTRGIDEPISISGAIGGDLHLRMASNPSNAVSIRIGNRPLLPVAFTINWREETTNENIPTHIQYKWSTQGDDAWVAGTNQPVSLEPGSETKTLQLRENPSITGASSRVVVLSVPSRSTSIVPTAMSIISTGLPNEFIAILSGGGSFGFLEFSDTGGNTWKPMVFIGKSTAVASNLNRDEISGAAAVPSPKTSEPFIVDGASSIIVRIAANDQQDRPNQHGTPFPIFVRTPSTFAGAVQRTFPVFR
jgi:hypothetical protein